MPFRIREVGPAKPQTAVFAVLLGALVARLIEARNSLAELFFGLHGRSVHRILLKTRGAVTFGE
jgi:hypothetical protein